MKISLQTIDTWMRKHIKLVTALTCGLLLASAFFCLKVVKYNNNIEFMLPGDTQVQQSMRFLREANFSDKLVVSLTLKDNTHSLEELTRAADELARSIDSPLVNQVITGANSGNFMQEMIFFLKYIPQLSSPGSLAQLDDLVTPQGIQERLGSIYRQSLSPQSSFTTSFARIDPFNLSPGILGNIQRLSQASGYNVTIEQGHFISPDKRSALVILKTSIQLTDGFGSHKIIQYLQEKIKHIPAYIKADIIAGHMHTVKNEEIVKRDIRLTTLIASWGFILLLLFAFRDYKALLIFLIPLGSVLVTTGITYLIFGELSYFVIGLSTVIAGIADDYGIYIYMAVRKAGNGLETIAKVRKPVIVGAFTTVSVFIVFFFSSVKGYHELAFFSNFSIILCLLYSLFIFPYYIQQDKRTASLPVKPEREFNFNLGIPDRTWVILWVLLLAVMLGLSSRLKFNNDITQFDGAGKEVAASEENFRRTWGNKELPAVFVIPAQTLEQAYELNSSLYAQATKLISAEEFSSLSSIWPALSVREENLGSWNKFWTPEKIAATKTFLSDYGAVYNFSSDAFDPFIHLLEDPQTLDIQPSGLSFFDQVQDQFLFKKNGAYQIISFFPDKDELVRILGGLKNSFPGSFIVSRKNFSRQVSQALGGEFLYLSVLAALLTLGLMIFSLKNLRLTIIACIPIITSLALVGGITKLAGLSLNIPAVIAGMVVMGLVSDYAIFMVYYCKYRYQTGTIEAVTLASVTTLIGAAVLLFARHPVLFSIGITLTAGILSGYLTSLILIPVAYRLWKE